MAKYRADQKRYTLDTSIQIDKFKPGSKSQQFVSTDNLLYSSNFVLYEFKSGFVKTLIEYFMLVKLSPDVPTALGTWSNRFSKRDQSNIHILSSVTGLMETSIETGNKEKALRQIEASIFFVLSNFESNLVGLVGDFGSDEVVKYDILASSDYQPFMNLIRSRKDIIQLDDFWRNHTAELLALLADETVYSTSALKSLLDKLKKINADISKANQFRINKGLGDAVIATDALGSMILASLDHSFDAMMPLLKKQNINITLS